MAGGKRSKRAYSGTARRRTYGSGAGPSVPLCLEDLEVGRLSAKNQAAVLGALPGASHVAGFRDWLKLGRCVARGSKALYIFAPRESRDGELFFKPVPVFDLSQTVKLEDRDQLEASDLEAVAAGLPAGGGQ